MAYSKQTWTDDVSAVTGARMTHIEQGIYDNSLATDKINPSGTATTTAEIEEGQITDAIGFKSLKLKGQTSQVSYNGYNILKGIIENKTTNGVTITKNEDNSYKVSGTATAVALFSTNINTTLEAGKTYVIGFSNSNSNVQLSIRPSDGSTQYANTTTQKYVTYTPNENIDIRLFVRVANGATVNETIHPIIYVGNTEKSYEPYVGEKASPNPEFPQDVNNVSGNNVIRISNKNLIDISQTNIGTAWNNSSASNRAICIIKCQPSTTYTISYSSLGTLEGIYRFERADETTTGGAPTQLTSTTTTVTTGSTTHYLGLQFNKSSIALSDLTSINIQIEKGNTATSYVAHQGNNFEINLGSPNAIINKNLIQDETFVQGGATDNTAITRISCRNIKLKANTTYTLSSTLDYNDFNINICTAGTAFPHAAPYTYDSGWKSENFSFTVGSSDVYANIAVRNSANITAIVPNDIAGYHFQIEKGDTATQYEKHFTPIELCKISTYQDYIYKNNGKWYKHKAIGKVVLNGTENWALESSGNSNFRYHINNFYDGVTMNNTNSYCNRFPIKEITNSTTDYGIYGSGTGYYFRIRTETEMTLDNFKTWLSSNNVVVYYKLATPIEEEITYTPLIRQLDELYNSGLYDVTNISQDNSSEAFILDFEACKNNINGIVEYIRR